MGDRNRKIKATFYEGRSVGDLTGCRKFAGLERQTDAEHQFSVEFELRVRGELDVFRLTKAVLLSREEEIADGDAGTSEGLDHAFGLVGWDDSILVPWKKMMGHLTWSAK